MVEIKPQIKFKKTFSEANKEALVGCWKLLFSVTAQSRRGIIPWVMRISWRLALA